MAFGSPDFARFAEAYGARGRRVEAIENFKATIERLSAREEHISSPFQSTGLALRTVVDI